MKYLYAASIHGIQSFIFKTNKLKEIVGASALLDSVFSSRDKERSLFDQYCEEKGINAGDLQVITRAAANFRSVVSKQVGEQIVKELPMYLAQKIPGVLFTQVLVPIKDGDFHQAYHQSFLLLQAQRNKSFISPDPPFMGVLKSRRTGGAVVNRERGEYMDAGTMAKLDFSKESASSFFKDFTGLKDVDRERLPHSFEHLIKQSESNNFDRKSWIAVVHADGNSIGKKVVSLLSKSDSHEQVKKFSEALADATKRAVNEACREVLEAKKEKGYYILRPIILGGDDITLVIRADKALGFVKRYLELFEQYTKENSILGRNGMTSCAGVAFIKHKFPFHYGVDLAEKLTKEAKKVSKGIDENLPPSSVSIFKVHSSYVEPLEEMRNRTYGVTVSMDEPQPLYAGPYFLDEPDKQNPGRYPLLGDLIQHAQFLYEARNNEEGQKAMSKLRQYVELLKTSPDRASLLLNRMKEVNRDFCEELRVEVKPSILYDVLSIYSMM